MNPLDDAGRFLVGTLFDLAILIVMLRWVLQWVGADFHNPISQFVVKLTNPIIQPLRSFLPVLKGFDLSVIVVLLILEMVKLILIVMLSGASFPNIFGLVLWSVAGLGNQLINIFFYAILLMIILSWINPMGKSPVKELLFKISEPLMRPARRFIPTVGGFDLTPIPVMIGLKLIAIIFIHPLSQLGVSLAIGI